MFVKVIYETILFNTQHLVCARLRARYCNSTAFNNRNHLAFLAGLLPASITSTSPERMKNQQHAKFITNGII